MTRGILLVPIFGISSVWFQLDEAGSRYESYLVDRIVFLGRWIVPDNLAGSLKSAMTNRQALWRASMIQVNASHAGVGLAPNR